VIVIGLIFMYNLLHRISWKSYNRSNPRYQVTGWWTAGHGLHTEL